VSLTLKSRTQTENIWVCDIKVKGSVGVFLGPYFLTYAIRSEKEAHHMALNLAEWEQRRQTISKQINQLGDFRPGSITSISGRCGKPECRCHRPGELGHGPNLRLTYKVDGKSVSESLPSAAAMRKAEREVALSSLGIVSREPDRSRNRVWPG
jgi:hypothetical protein